jgi:hypothetical protein
VALNVKRTRCSDQDRGNETARQRKTIWTLRITAIIFLFEQTHQLVRSPSVLLIFHGAAV